MGVLKNVLTEASYNFIHTSNLATKSEKEKFGVSQKALVFLESSSLDNMLKEYALDYNPEEIRERFNEIFKIKNP